MMLLNTSLRLRMLRRWYSGLLSREEMSALACFKSLIDSRERM